MPERTGGPAGWMIGAFVVVFAGLMAAFPARNPEVWMHLAAGRQMVSPAATNPQSFSPVVERAWLANVIGYGLYSQGGEKLLLGAKVLLCALLAWLLARMGYLGVGWFVPALGAILSILAMSHFLQLQTTLFSFLFLAITWFLIDRDDSAENRWFASWWLPPLFLLWTNLDRGAVIGLGVVALHAIGSLLEQRKSSPKSGAFIVGRLIGLAVLCQIILLNRVVMKNPGWDSIAWTFQGSGVLDGPLVSPLSAEFRNALWATPSGGSYAFLLLLGLFSFFLSVDGWPWARFLPWIALAAGSVMDVRLVPYFAVLAGPMLSRHLQMGQAIHGSGQGLLERIARRHPLLGGILTVPCALLLLGAAWPGWLFGPPFEPRRLEVQTSPALTAAADAVRSWETEGTMPPGSRGIHLSPATASVFSWFSPGQSVVQLPSFTSSLHQKAWNDQDILPMLRDAKIDYLVMNDPSRMVFFPLMERLLGERERFPLLWLEGDVAIFGFPEGKETVASGTSRKMPPTMDLRRQALFPDSAHRAPSSIQLDPQLERPWWEAFWKTVPPESPGAAEAALFYFLAEATRPTAAARHQRFFDLFQIAGLTASPPGNPSTVMASLDAAFRLGILFPRLADKGPASGKDAEVFRLRQGFAFGRDDLPPGLLYLGLRSARRALANNPTDATTQFILGEIYLALIRGTRERSWKLNMEEMAQIRYTQAVTALNQALQLQPMFLPAHRTLVGTYIEMNYLDLALEHAQKAYRLMLAPGAGGGQPSDAMKEQRAQMEKEIEKLTEVVNRMEAEYNRDVSTLRILDRAILALQKGLATKALNMLLESDISAFGPRGMALELDLMLRTGRARDVMAWTEESQKQAIGPLNYHWVRAQAAAALGDYSLVDGELGDLGKALIMASRKDGPYGERDLMGLLVAQSVLDEQPGIPSLPFLVWRLQARNDFWGRTNSLARSLRQQADMRVMRGLMAFEEGRTNLALAAFREASLLRGTDSVSGLDFPGKVMAQFFMDWLKE